MYIENDDNLRMCLYVFTIEQKLKQSAGWVFNKANLAQHYYAKSALYLEL